jgi:predicted GNAT family acetyltransferase
MHGDAELLYRIKDQNIVIYRTYVPIQERGRGIATELAETAFEYAKEHNLNVVEACEFIADYIKGKNQNE